VTQFLAAFGAGAASFLSPCILPLLPGYLSLISGYSAAELLKDSEGKHSRRVLQGALLFCAGFAIAFSLLGAAASAVGMLLDAWRGPIMKGLGVLMVVMGLQMAGVFDLRFFNYEKRVPLKKFSGTHYGAFLMGFAFALGWSPCIGPILSGILVLAAGQEMGRGMALLFVYSLGLAAPFLAAAWLTVPVFGLLSRFRGGVRKVEIAAGVVLAVFGALLFFDRLMFVG
jgi:cytochrome c-type biogenesis protein